MHKCLWACLALYCFKLFVVKVVVSDPRGRYGTCPLQTKNFLNFMQFFDQSGKFVCWRPPPGGWVPPPTGNPGSAPELICKLGFNGQESLIKRWHLLLCVFKQSTTARYSSGSSGRVRGAEKHENYATAFCGHLFYDLFSQGQGAIAPSAPRIRYCHLQNQKSVRFAFDWNAFLFSKLKATGNHIPG